MSLRLHAGNFYLPFPDRELALHENLEILRALRGRVGTHGENPLLHFLRRDDLQQFHAQALDDCLREIGRAEYSLPCHDTEVGQSGRLGNGRQIGRQ